MSSASSLIAEVSVIMEENPDEQERTAILTITADRIKESKTVTITQAAKGTLLVQGFDDPFPSEGGEATFTITSNKAWKVTSSNQWLTLDKDWLIRHIPIGRLSLIEEEIRLESRC